MKIAIIDQIHEGLYRCFEKKGWECVTISNDVTKQDFANEIHRFDGIIIRSKFTIDSDILLKAKSLKFIGRPGAGLDLIDVDYCNKNNIKCFRSPEGNRDAVAEHAVGMLLCLFNKICQGNSQVKNGVWNRKSNMGIELNGKTVGIVGYGYMGEAFAKRLQGFDVEVIAYDKYKEKYGSEFVKESSLNELFEKSDIVSIHTPLTSETFKMVNKEWIESFKKPFYLINTSRGKSNDLTSINQGLSNGKILGACLDVLPDEDVLFEQDFILDEQIQKLISFENVILTPHVAGITKESFEKMCVKLAEKIIAFY